MTTTRAPRQPRRATRQSPSAADSATRSSNPSDHFRYALTAPTQASRDTVALAESSITRLFDLDHHSPARILLPTVARHLDDVATLLRGTLDKALRRRLIASGGQAAALAGRLALDRGDEAAAHKYWDGAMAAARDAAEGPLLACVLMYLSHAAMQ